MCGVISFTTGAEASEKVEAFLDLDELFKSQRRKIYLYKAH